MHALIRLRAIGIHAVYPGTTWSRPAWAISIAVWACCISLCAAAPAPRVAPVAPKPAGETHRESRNLELAIRDLAASCPDDYPRGQEYLNRLEELNPRLLAGEPAAKAQLSQLRREALLDNPLLRSGRVLLIKRQPKKGQSREQGGPGVEIGMPSNHECNSSLERDGYDNEICVLDLAASRGGLKTVYRPPDGGYVGELDLHWDGLRLLFTKSDVVNWKVFEMHVDGSGVRQVSRMPDDVDSFDACYLPNGKIIFGSTASFQAVPCWHGQKRVSNLYLMNGDGSSARQLCFDQDHNFHPTVLPNGAVLFHRWDYTGINHIYLRQLMLMKPDGTGQRAVYGSSSWYPNSLYFPRPLPGDPGRLVSILSGYHGVHRLGQLVVLDLNQGWQEADGITLRISGRGDPINPVVKDDLVNADWPKFLHPEPISDKHFLVSAWLNSKGHWGIYLADVFDNLVLIHEEPGYALLEPLWLRPRPTPPVLAEQFNPAMPEAVVYLHNVYAGPGLAGVPRGTVKSLRVIAYHFGYPGLAGPDLIGYGGPWEVMQILGTVPLEQDGSAIFKVPADTPIALQALNAKGEAVQLMRSWFSARRGESVSCVGCHEPPPDAAASVRSLASLQAPREIDPWRGPARGFDFEREVQPLLNRHCVPCHDSSGPGPDLRPVFLVTNYTGRAISQLGIQRLHPRMFAETKGVLRFAPAYDALIHYIRRVGIEDDVSLLTPGEYQADTSPLIQMLRSGHHAVQLNAEEWDRLITWIDLNAPCHGTWGEVYPIPDGVHERRMALRAQCGGPLLDPERIPFEEPAPQIGSRPQSVEFNTPEPAEVRIVPSPDGEPRERVLRIADGVNLKLVRVPAGELLAQGSGSAPGVPGHTAIQSSFWMGAFEISNEQYRCFDPGHDPRYYTRRHARSDDQGLGLNGPRQPVVRVSWDEAMAFCRWLSQRTGLTFSLPTEAQWEWACRAGTITEMHFGRPDADFSAWGNMADLSFSKGLLKDGTQTTGGLLHMVLEGAALSDTRFNDGQVVTANVGSYQPNAWGLYDLHGNAAEWTLANPHQALEPRPSGDSDLRAVRGGSFFDSPKRCQSSSRVEYQKWRRVFNVGFRVVCE